MTEVTSNEDRAKAARPVDTGRDILRTPITGRDIL